MELNIQQQKVINKVARENGFDNFKLKVEAGSKIGDNFAGTITKVTIEDDIKKKVVVIKTSQKPKSLESNKIYITEIYMYETVFEEFARFEENCNIANKFTAHPKLLGKGDTKHEEFLILDDMREQGFQMWNKIFFMNSSHIEIVLKEYAKFHSISFAMRATNSELFEKVTKDISEPIRPEVIKSMMDGFMRYAYNCSQQEHQITEALKRYEKCIPDLLKDVTNSIYSNKTVVTHGDCWCNNFLFKYKDENKDTPSEICILDWQLSKLSSLAGDLVYFLYANGSEEVLNDYKRYLKVYYEAFCQHLDEFSCDSAEILSYEQLEQMFTDSCKFFFPILFIILKVQLCDPDDASNFNADTDSGKDFEDAYSSFKIKNMDEFYRRIKVVIKFLEKNNLL